MTYLKKLIGYFSEHVALAAVIGACVLLIVVAVVALCAKKSKAKKAPKAAPSKAAAPATNVVPTVTNQTAPATAESVQETAEPVQETAKEPAQETTEEPAVTEKSAQEEAPHEEPIEEPIEEPAETPAEAPIEEPVEEPTEEPAQEKPAKSKSAKAKNEKITLEELKNAPEEDENAFFDEEDEQDKIARYSGKWVICRVMTAIDGEHSDMAAKDETYFFELRASNGEKLLTSEEYTTYSGALGGIKTHKLNIAKGNFKIMPSKKGDYIFKLLNGKNLLLCMGENYATRARCESAIESAKRFAATAIIDENVQDIIIDPPVEDDETEPREFIDNGYKGKWIIRANTAPDGEQVFYFELYASNGEKLLSSEEYTTYIGAVNGIETHKTNIERGNFRVSLTKRGDYIYKLLNGNGQLLCLGEHYKTRRRCENAIESVRRFAKNAPVLADSETVTKHS